MTHCTTGIFAVVLPVVVHSTLSLHCLIVVCVSSVTRQTLDCADHKPKYVKGYALLSESGYPHRLCLQPCERMDVFYLVYIAHAQTEIYSPIKKSMDTNHIQLEQHKALIYYMNTASVCAPEGLVH